MNKIQAVKTTFCNKCQAPVTWQRSYKSYKWYLTNVDTNGETSRDDFHSCRANQDLPTPNLVANVIVNTPDNQPDIAVVTNHEAMENAIKDNRDVLVASLNGLYTKPETCEGTICPPTNFKPVKQVATGLYQCQSTPHVFTHLVTPGKPVMCDHCNKIARFVKITT